MTLTAQHRLASYGTLAPGRSNAHHLEGLSGIWTTGTVRGNLVNAGWGARLGFPGLILDPEGDEVAVDVFVSADLPVHWQRLDAFEGGAYRRVPVTVNLDGGGEFEASIYEVIQEPTS